MAVSHEDLSPRDPQEALEREYLAQITVAADGIEPE
jgi:hypothetical protein